MIHVLEVTTVRYDETKYGFFQARRRRTRVHFNVQKRSASNHRRGIERYRTETPDKTLRLLLPSVYEKMIGNPMAPIPMPEKVNAHWNEKEQAFILIRGGFTGYEIWVTLEQTQEDAVNPDVIETDEDDAERLHGSPLPRMGR